jgi:hypothetical protein
VGAEGSGKGDRERAKAEVSLKLCIFREIGVDGGGGGVAGVRGGFEKGEEEADMGSVHAVCKRARSSKFVDGPEPSKQVCIREVEGTGGRGSWAVGCHARWIEASDDGLVGGGHGSSRHGLEKSQAGGVVFIVVGEVLGLLGSGRVNGAEGRVCKGSHQEHLSGHVEGGGKGVGSHSIIASGVHGTVLTIHTQSLLLRIYNTRTYCTITTYCI